MPSLTELLTATILFTPTTAFKTPSPLRTTYLPPYGTIRSSSIIVSSSRDYEREGNYWTNPPMGMDRYPSSTSTASSITPLARGDTREGGSRETSYNGFIRDEVTVSGGRAGSPRKEPTDWWETERRGNENGDEYYEDDDYYDDEEYGLPPPSRSRSSFRTGAPPPPRPIRDFYNKLFWFGFDPSATQPTDRTMFGGTRGKFNAMSLLRDREMRQSQRSLRGKRSYDPAIQNFGDVGDWNARKMGTSPAGGKEVGDDAVVEQLEDISDMKRDMRLPPGEERIPIMDVEFDEMMMDEDPYYEDEYWEEDVPRSRVMERRRTSRDLYFDDEDEDDLDFELERRPRRSDRRMGRRRGGRGRRSSWFSLPTSKREQADAYDRYIGLSPRRGDEFDDMDDEYDRPRSRRRAGYAYKYNRDYDDDEDDFYDDFDDDIIDIRPKRSSSRRRSWEERAMEMDRIPPRSVTAWGPNGRADGDAQTLAALEAEREIEKARKYVNKKEDMVDDAKQDVVSLKADKSFYEKQLDQGRETREAKRELGYIIRDIEDASRILRMAKAERDAAIKKLDRLESKHWALLSEYDAVRTFEMD